MIDNNSAPVAAPPGTSLGLGASPSLLPSGNVPPHMMLARGGGGGGQAGEFSGRAPMKEYMDRVADKRKWEDVSSK